MHRKAGFPEPAGCWGKDVVTGGDRHLSEPGVEVVGPEERVNVDKEFEVGSVGSLGKPSPSSCRIVLIYRPYYCLSLNILE